MLLSDLFEDVSAYDVKRVEAALDRFVYQPEEKVKTRQPVLDVDLPVKSAHFFQRLNQRKELAKIDLGQIYNMLKRAKTDPSMGYSQILDMLAKEDDPRATIVIQDEDDLQVPVIIHANPECETCTDGNPVCKTKTGTAPRNMMTAKTIYRKGVDD